jgi:hypothetical protein
MSGDDAIVRLAPRPSISDEAKATVIEHAKKILELAEKGEIATLFATYKLADGCWDWDHSATDNFPEMIGRIEIAKQAAIAKWEGRQ